MPVSVESAVSGPFTPNGVTTSFAFDFKAVSTAEVGVVDQDGEALSSALFSVTVDADEGGSVLFSVAPLLADYDELYIVSTPALTQTADFDNAGSSFNPRALTRALDRAAIRDLALQAQINRTFTLPFGETGTIIPPLVDRAGKFLAFDAGGIPTATSGTGADSALREDLANSAIGAALIALAGGETIAQALALFKTISSLSRFVAGTGPTWPYYNLTYDRQKFGSSTTPLVPIAPGDGYTSPFTRELYLGAGHEGGAEVGHFLLQVRGAANPASANPNQNYTPLQTFNSVTVPLGGTALTMAASKGQLFGFGSIAVAYPGATNLRNLTGGEFNVQANLGSSVAYKSGIQIVATPDDKVQGTTYDASVSISAQVGAVGSRHGILFSAANGQQAVKSDGTLIGTLDGGAFTYGVDLRLSSFSANAFCSNNFAVNGSGDITGRNVFLDSSGAVLRLGVGGVASTVALRGRTSGLTAGLYDAQIAFFGGGGTQGQGGISVDCSVFQPAATNYATNGGPSNFWANTYSHLLTIPERTAASVTAPAAGTQVLFIDSADNKLKRKNSAGTVTIIA